MDIREILKERILVLDGAMGTMIQPRRAVVSHLEAALDVGDRGVAGIHVPRRFRFGG